MTTKEAYRDLMQQVREAGLIESIGGLLGWDERTYMPVKGSNHRAEQIAFLAKLGHEKLTSPRIGELLAAVEKTEVVEQPDSVEAVNVRETRRRYDRAVKVPARLVEELARVTTRAQNIWQEARKKNDFPAFARVLANIVALKREEADAVGYADVPYDALLDEFEPGARAKAVTAVFALLRADLVKLLEEIIATGKKPRTEILHREYAVDRQRVFAEAAAAAIGFDFGGGRLDSTVHPFCSGIGPGDCRLTTRYNPRFFSEAFFGTLHEAGHGIYDQGLDPDHFGTPMGTFVSLGIHESQSRLWENQVGRGGPFWQHFFPRLQQTFAGTLDDIGVDDFLFAINDVEPSFIRVEADEATYNVHIILRFELEQALLTGDLKTEDLPGAWNEKFQAMMGLTPRTDAEGCLQDIHWSCGAIGYFPTYTLGNLFAAQFMDKAREDLGDLDGDFRAGRFGRLKEWLNTNIHRQGQRFKPPELCEKITGKPLSHAPLMKYLRDKYAALYGI